MEEQVRQAALQAITFWQTKGPKTTTGGETVHPKCAFMVKYTADTDFVSFLQDDDDRPESVLPTTTTTDPPQLPYVKIVPVGRRSAASVQVAMSGFGGVLVLLRPDNSSTAPAGWKVISVALAPSSSSGPVLPEHFARVNDLTWNGYCHANRVCDGDLMAEYFHPTCRLTHSGGPDDIEIIGQPAFCDKVRYRYTDKEPLHVPFAHLKDDTTTTGAGDTLQSVDLLTPHLALVTCKVGHPPFLWTDLLTCARLSSSSSSTEGRWWIVHKSSDSEPFLLEHARDPSATS